MNHSRCCLISLSALAVIASACDPSMNPVTGQTPLIHQSGATPDDDGTTGGDGNPCATNPDCSGTGTTTTDTPNPGSGVVVEVERIHGGPATVSFGVPVAPGALRNIEGIEVEANGRTLPATVSELLGDYNGRGERVGVRSFLVQFDSTEIEGSRTTSVSIRWGTRGGATVSGEPKAYATPAISTVAPAVAKTTQRAVAKTATGYALQNGPVRDVTVFTGRESKFVARLPDGYLARTGVLGMQTGRATADNPKFSGLAFLSDALETFVDASMYRDPYEYNPHPESVVDEVADYSAWLYDRCATYLSAYSHIGDVRFLRDAQKACSYYSGAIALTGANAGTFTGKASPDPKYSHLRGLYAYYALTGDEAAREAGKAIADLWLREPYFVAPYRKGHVLGKEKVWTERLLATSLEGLVYGYLLTGDPEYFDAAEDLVDTAYKHLTGDAATLAQINPGANFPPQNCFIHSGLQQVEQGSGDPWCSPWMTAMLVDPLLTYQGLSGDRRVDEMFIRLGRFLRDTGTTYFTKDPHNDAFLEPTVCDDPNAGAHRRRLVPLYGAGINAAGKRVTFGEWSDFEHCPDATALSAAALAALKRSGDFDKNPIGPFASEGESFEALHQELAHCAKLTFEGSTRPKRNPDAWSSAELAAGFGNSSFIDQNRIGFPMHLQMPRRKLSWWFNEAIEQYAILDAASMEAREIVSGWVQPSSCR